jgi:hypothetical protein
MAIPEVENFLLALHDDFLGTGQFGDFHIPRFCQGNVRCDPKFGFAASFLNMDVNQLQRSTLIGKK